MRLPEWVQRTLTDEIPDNYRGQIRLNCTDGGVVNIEWDRKAFPPMGWRQREAQTRPSA